MEIGQLRDLLAKATPGAREWELDKYGEDTFDGNVTVDVTTPNTDFLFHADSGTEDFTKARECPEVIEAQLIVAAINALPALLDAAEAAGRMADAMQVEHPNINWEEYNDIRSALAKLKAL